MSTSNSKTQSAPTVSQVVGALSVKQIWSLVAATATAFSSVAGIALWLGHRTAEISGQEKLNIISAKLAKSETEQLILKERAQQSAEKLRQYVDYAASLNTQIAQREAKVAALNERLGRANTCEYIQQQISSLEQQIANISNGKRIRSGIIVFGGNEEEQRKRDEARKQQDDAELTRLQQRFLAYSDKLSACAKT